MVLVAAAGPAMISSLRCLRRWRSTLLAICRSPLHDGLADNLRNALILNVVPAVFNLFPLPPLDGGRILVGILPKVIAARVARARAIRVGNPDRSTIILPMLGAQLGIDLSLLSHRTAALPLSQLVAGSHSGRERRASRRSANSCPGKSVEQGGADVSHSARLLVHEEPHLP
jgi:Zn-dependent protease